MATPAAPSLVRVTGKGAQPAVVQRLRDAELELHALRSERDAVRIELVTLRNLITYAFGQDSWFIALNVRDRITSLCARLERRGGAS